jgi:hypothetical protein
VHLVSQLTQRVADRAQIALAPSIMWWRNPQQFVEQVAGEHVVGDVRQTTVSLVTRLDYSFTPTLSLQLYAQPFLSAGTYRRLGATLEPHARDPRARIRRFAPDELSLTSSGDWRVDSGAGAYDFARPDFTLNELRSNSVLRWEYRPGSTLFLVWSHGRSADGVPEAFDLQRQARELRALRGDHVFLLKVSHWLGR